MAIATTNTVAPSADSASRAAARFDLERQAAQSLTAQRAYLDTLIPAGLAAAEADETALRNAALTRGVALLDSMSPRDLHALATTLQYLADAMTDHDTPTTTSRRNGLRLVKAGAR